LSSLRRRKATKDSLIGWGNCDPTLILPFRASDVKFIKFLGQLS